MDSEAPGAATPGLSQFPQEASSDRKWVRPASRQEMQQSATLPLPVVVEEDDPVQEDLQQLFEEEPDENFWIGWLRDLSVSFGRLLIDSPAWLVSLVIHLVAMILLALLTPNFEETEPVILLTAGFSEEQEAEEDDDGLDIVVEKTEEDAKEEEMPEEEEPGEEEVEEEAEDPEEEQLVELPIPDEHQPKNAEEREALMQASSDARQLLVDGEDVEGLPSMFMVTSQLKAGVPRHYMLSARDPRIRLAMVRAEGGTLFTEAAVARGLAWMARHQMANGRWSLHQFCDAPECDGRCGGAGQKHTDISATALALLSFLGAGQTHRVGNYRTEVDQGLDWLIDRQTGSGSYHKGHHSNMYGHGLATIALCEAYALTDDARCRGAAQKAVDFISKAQHSEGGWRYAPNTPGDTSVVGWQLMALQSAKAAGLSVPFETTYNAGRFLDSVSVDGGSQYAYLPGQKAKVAMTAEGLLCRIYLGWEASNPALSKGTDFLLNRHLPATYPLNEYYVYYATQVMHHMGGRRWERWNNRIRELLVASQETEGCEAGSWHPGWTKNHVRQGGRLYCTAMGICTLEVYYRHLPIYRQIDLEQDE